jgi:hypothetical protein
MSEYTCVYGISSESDLPPGGIEVVHGHDVSALAIVGKEKRTFWFLINKMDQQYRVPNIPRWTKKDAEKRIQAHLDFRITDKVTLGDIWILEEQNLMYSCIYGRGVFQNMDLGSICLSG